MMTAEMIHVPEEAPFSAEQREWLNGFLRKALGGGVVEVFEEERFGKKRPFPSRILENRNLNGEGSGKETRHVALSLEGSGLEYEVGDALGVVPMNSAEVVDELISALGFEAEVEVPLPDGGTGSLREALIGAYDIRNLAPKFLEGWSERSGSEELQAVVEAGKDALVDFAWGRELIDLVVEHPVAFADAGDFVSVLKKLQPRLYSIASSPKAHPGEVHLTVGIVRYESHGRSRGGVCSTFLADRASELSPGVFVHSNKAFRPPADDTTPMIMVGPGTGIAPFRAFLEEREAMGASGKNWLFFGNPHVATDFLYDKQLAGMLESGVLNRLDTAFSRDQKEKVYVQDRMVEFGAELWKWLEEGAAFYVCGDASRMAKDVDQALHKVVEVHGGMTAEEAVGYVKGLKKEKRYCRDVY